jgi:NAD(P)-dependent dehydrogenase (short-subunit alcohol dehydrogenase family)
MEKNSMKRLQNKVAVITGGNSGIGEGIAKCFFHEGAHVAIFGRNQETLARTKQGLDDKILTVAGDITHTDDIKKLYVEVHKKFGKIDILIVNAGIGERIHIENVTEEKFDKLTNINYRGAYFTVRYALDYLNHPASIVFIASCGGKMTLKRHSVYASNKAAVIKLAQNMSYDLAQYGIRVNSISPGYIETPIFAERLKTDPTYLKKREANIPLKRIGTPQDVANAALFLSSDEASYITGIDLLVDGGYSASFPEPE